MAEKIVAFEVANSYVKIFDGKKSEVYLNTLKRAPKMVFNMDSAADTYEVLGEKYLLSKTTKYEATHSKSEERYNNINFKREALIAISKMVRNQEEVVAVTGLPATHFNETNVNRLRDLLEGEHEVIKNGKPISFNVKKLYILLQPLGTWFAQLVSTKGMKSYNFDQLMESDALVLDIGFESSDIAELSEGNLMEFTEGGSAMSSVYADIIEELRARYPEIQSIDIRLFQVEQQLLKGDILTFANVEYDTKEIKDRVFKRHADRIMSELLARRDLKEYGTVVFTGGGFEALRPYFPESLYHKQNFVPAKEPQLENVKGFYSYVRYITGDFSFDHGSHEEEE